MKWILLVGMVLISGECLWAAEAEAGITESGFSKQIQFSVEKYQLKNGLTVLLHVDPSTPIVSVHQWFRVGSRNEKPGRTGLAHFFEHLMFKGTPKYSGKVLDRLMQANGGVNNAFTTRDYTGYYENFPSGKLDLILDIESDRMRNLVFEEKEIQSEREVVKEERRFRVENEVSGYLFEALFKSVYKVHPYTWPVIGYMADLNAATIPDLKEFYRIHYAPNNAVLAIGGDFDANEAKKLIEKYYASIPAQELPKDKITPEPEQKAPREVTMLKDVQNPTFALAYKASHAGHEDSYVLDIIAQIIGAGTSSRLHKKLVYQQQLANSVSAWAHSPQDDGIFAVTVSVRPGKNVNSVVSVIQAELKNLREKLVSSQELEKAKNQIMKDYVDGLKTVAGRTQAIALNETTFHDYTQLFKDLDRYQGVTLQQVRTVAQKYLQPNRQNLIKVLPKSKKGTGEKTDANT